MRDLFRIVVGSIIGCTVSCSWPIDFEAERNALLESDRAWAAAAADGEVQRLSHFWADDAVNYFPGAPPAQGNGAIRELVRRNRSQPGFSLSWEPTEATVSRAADMGYTSGTFDLTVHDPDGNPATRRGSYVSIWKKQADGSWQCIVETTIFGP